MSEPEDDFDGGWDNRVSLVDGRWVHRTPRFPDREDQLRREATLLPWLAPLLPLPVPALEVVSEEPFTVRHEYLPGGPCPGTSAAHGTAIAKFLRVLHGIDPEEARRHGARDADAAHAALGDTLARMRREVLPLLDRPLVSLGEALLARVAARPAGHRLTHGDLGPEHIRVVGERIGGVIDWGDSGLGDSAVDLAWTVCGSGPNFSAALVAAYRPSEDMLARARDWHLLGPWHEVLYGLDTGQDAFVRSGLAGTRSRLKRAVSW